MKKRAAAKSVNDIDIPEQWEEGGEGDIHEEGGAIDSLQMGKLVREFLEAQSLTVLPQNLFGSAVTDFVDRDDRDAMAQFVNESLGQQINHLIGQEEIENVEILQEAMENYRIDKEKVFETRNGARSGTTTTGAVSKQARKLKQRPEDYDSNLDGPWEDNPDALAYDGHADSDVEMISDTPPVAAGAKRGAAKNVRGRGTKAAAASSRPAAKTGATRGKAAAIIHDDEEEEENESDVNMQLGSDPESDSQSLFVSSKRATTTTATKTTGRRLPASSAAKKATTSKPTTSRGSKAAAAGTSPRQSRLDFAAQAAPPKRASPRASRAAVKKPTVIELSDDEIEDDDDDAFESLPVKKTAGKRR
jgi:double-strand break repair protein MRE11